MTRKIAINGFGRIGRQVFRILEGAQDIEVVAINDLTPPEMSAHLLKYDSVHGRFDADVKVVDNGLTVNGRFVRVSAERNPADLYWGDLGVEVVLECTGVFRSKEKAQAHIEAGARWVIISAPGQNVDNREPLREPT